MVDNEPPKKHVHEWWPQLIGHEENSETFIIKLACITEIEACETILYSVVEAEDF